MAQTDAPYYHQTHSTFQVSSDAQTTLDITVSAELDFRAILLRMLTGSYIHPRDLGLRLNIPVIVAATWLPINSPALKV